MGSLGLFLGTGASILVLIGLEKRGVRVNEWLVRMVAVGSITLMFGLLLVKFIGFL